MLKENTEATYAEENGAESHEKYRKHGKESGTGKEGIQLLSKVHKEHIEKNVKILTNSVLTNI